MFGQSPDSPQVPDVPHVAQDFAALERRVNVLSSTLTPVSPSRFVALEKSVRDILSRLDKIEWDMRAQGAHVRDCAARDHDGHDAACARGIEMAAAALDRVAALEGQPAVSEKNRVSDPPTEPSLLPCPFCGGEAKVREIASSTMKVGATIEARYIAGCFPCRMETDSSVVQADAIAHWNRRAPAAPDELSQNPGELDAPSLNLDEMLDTPSCHEHHGELYTRWDYVRAERIEPLVEEVRRLRRLPSDSRLRALALEVADSATPGNIADLRAYLRETAR